MTWPDPLHVVQARDAFSSSLVAQAGQALWAVVRRGMITPSVASDTHGLVLDGELVVWDGERLSFEALQRRAVSGGRSAAQLAAAVTLLCCWPGGR
ncbi:hypothetical protein ACIHCQ_29435 [Streptomyces sp. NPDC052236]|uniref:hypothetical protein n=1 Tax=Streptomyces sp. NPDC052236 TaxID=3365686 RepID=UPI0037D36C81